MATKLSLKYITAVTFTLPHLSASSGVNAARSLLASLPSAPSRKNPNVPAIVVKTTPGPSSVELTYSNKKTMKISTDQEIKFVDLLRKVSDWQGLVLHGKHVDTDIATSQIEGPARALRLAELSS